MSGATSTYPGGTDSFASLHGIGICLVPPNAWLHGSGLRPRGSSAAREGREGDFFGVAASPQRSAPP